MSWSLWEFFFVSRPSLARRRRFAAFLKSALPLIQAEQGTTAWFGIQLGPSSFGIFDAFPDETGRQAHMTGQVAAALRASWSDLLSSPPSVQKVDILAAKLP